VTAGPRWRLAEQRHGSLPVMLLALTLISGVMDAISVLTLGRVFVANMTGNVVILGFAIAGVPELSLVTSLAVLVAFVLGAAAGGRLYQRFDQRGTLLRSGVLIEWVLLAVCLVMVLVQAPAVGSPWTVTTAALAAVAMGLQTAVARRIAVPDLNTSVVSMSVTALAADSTHGSRDAVLRRASAVLSLLVGAVVGAVIVGTAGPAAGLGLILLLLAGVAVAAPPLVSRGPDWED
jgi:uncharacterized membrane protein YoaK (UPF0700 family)